MSVAGNNTNIILNGDGSVPVMWILIAGIGHKRFTVKLLQEYRTQPWAVGCTEEARGRAAGINISEQEKTWLRREKQRSKGLKKDEEVWRKERKGGWWGERAQKGAMEGHLQRWHLIQHNLSHSGYCTVTYSSMLGLSEAKPLFLSLSIAPSVSPLTFLLYKLSLLLFLSFWYFYTQLRIYDLWWFYFLQYHVIVII